MYHFSRLGQMYCLMRMCTVHIFFKLFISACLKEKAVSWKVDLSGNGDGGMELNFGGKKNPSFPQNSTLIN